MRYVFGNIFGEHRFLSTSKPII